MVGLSVCLFPPTISTLMMSQWRIEHHLIFIDHAAWQGIGKVQEPWTKYRCQSDAGRRGFRGPVYVLARVLPSGIYEESSMG